MLSEECRSECLKALEENKEKLNEEIGDLDKRINYLERNKTSFEPMSSQFRDELEPLKALRKAKQNEFNRTEIRLARLNDGTFDGACPDCGGDIGDILKEYPLMERCPSCQMKKNSKSKRGRG
jgi:RNA polymerase-binding transcription factor DksA